MRKFTALSLAVALCMMPFTVSCSEKTSENAVSEPVPEMPTEPVFTEYFPEDFKTIRVNFDYQEGKPPLNFVEHELSIRVTPKMSPCKADYDGDDEFTEPEWVFVDDSMDEEERRQIIEAYRDEWEKENEWKKRTAESPYAAIDPWMTCGGGYAYALVNYDNLCGRRMHCFDILRIDMETGEQQVIFSRDDRENAICVGNMKAVGDEVYIEAVNFDHIDIFFDRKLYRINEADNCLEEVDTTAFSEIFNGEWKLSRYFEDRLTVQGWCSSDEPDTAGGYRLAEYNFDTGEWQYVIGADLTNGYSGTLISYGGKAVKSETDEDNKLSCTVDGVFTLHTGLRSARVRSARDNMVSVTVNDAVGNNFLYVYDLAKKERYDYDLTGSGTNYGESYPINGDAIYMTQSGGAFILFPSMGAAFRFGGHTAYYYNGAEVVTFDIEDSQGRVMEYVDPNGGYYNGMHRNRQESDTKERSQKVKVTLIS